MYLSNISFRSPSAQANVKSQILTESMSFCNSRWKRCVRLKYTTWISHGSEIFDPNSLIYVYMYSPPALPTSHVLSQLPACSPNFPRALPTSRVLSQLPACSPNFTRALPTSRVLSQLHACIQNSTAHAKPFLIITLKCLWSEN